MSHAAAQAAKELGRIVHFGAVKIGSKTALGDKVGVSRSTIVLVTTGRAHSDRVSKSVLRDLADNLRGVIGNREYTRLIDLIGQVKPAS